MAIYLLLVMAVAFLPFPTMLMAEAIRTEGAARAAVIFYGGAWLVNSLLLGALWGSAVLDRSAQRPEVDEGDRAGDHASHRLLRGDDRSRVLRTARGNLRVTS